MDEWLAEMETLSSPAALLRHIGGKSSGTEGAEASQGAAAAHGHEQIVAKRVAQHLVSMRRNATLLKELIAKMSDPFAQTTAATSESSWFTLP